MTNYTLNSEDGEKENADLHSDKLDSSHANNASKETDNLDPWIYACLGEKVNVNMYEEYLKESTTPAGKMRFRKMVYDNFENIPDNLKHVIWGQVFDGNVERDVSEKPEWLDLDKLRRGQKFARKYIFSINYTEYLSLFAMFSYPDALKPLVLTGKSGTPYTAFTRYYSTLMRMLNWYTFDHWSAGSPANCDFIAVRKMHKNIRKKICESSKEDLAKGCRVENPWTPSRDTLLEDFRSSCPDPEPGQCPYHILNMDTITKKPLNQGEMCTAQFAFMGLLVLYPNAFGVYASDDELESFCHVWQSIGYHLGIEDEFNICRGTLKDVRERCQDLLEVWVKPNMKEISPEWEHMIRCIVEGMSYYFPTFDYESNLLYFTDILNLSMPRLKKKMTFFMWMRYRFLRIFFSHIMRLPGVPYLMATYYRYKMGRVKKFSARKHLLLQKRSAKTLEEYKKAV